MTDHDMGGAWSLSELTVGLSGGSCQAVRGTPVGAVGTVGSLSDLCRISVGNNCRAVGPGLNVGRADFSGHPLMNDAALARLLDCCPALRSVDVTGCALNVGLTERALAARGFVYSAEAGDGLLFVRDSG